MVLQRTDFHRHKLENIFIVRRSKHVLDLIKGLILTMILCAPSEKQNKANKPKDNSQLTLMFSLAPKRIVVSNRSGL